MGPDVRVEPRPVIEGPFVEVRDVLLTPRHPRGIRFLDGITLPTLIQIVECETAVAQIIPGYLSSPAGQHCTPEAVRQMLARLYYEGVLTAIAPDESRSG